MKREIFASVSLLSCFLGHSLGVDDPPASLLKPFLDDSGQPIPRAEPVSKPIPRAEAVGKPIPRAEPVTTTPKSPTPPGTVKPAEVGDPNTIRITPSGTLRSPAQLQVDVANAYYAQKKFEQAAPEYEKFLSLYPNSSERPEALFRLGECYRLSGTTNAAKNSYETLLAQFQNGDFIGPAAYQLAQLYFADRQYRDALSLYRKAAVRLKDPLAANSAKFFSGRCMEALGQKLEARVAYEELLTPSENNPFQDASRLSVALLLKDSGRNPEALRQIQILAAKTENPDIKLESTVRSGLWSLEVTPPQTPLADAAFKKAITLPGSDHWKEIAQLGILRIAFDAGKYQQVVDSYNRPGSPTPVNLRPEFLIIVGNSFRQLNKTDEALKIFDQVAKEFPDTAYAKDAQYERLKMLYSSGDAQALTAIDQYLTANPQGEKHDQILLMKAELFFKKQDYATAAPIYSALELSRQLSGTMKAEALFKLGWCQKTLGATSQATKAFTAFIDGYPTHKLVSGAMIQRGICWESQKNYGAALADYSDIIQKFPQSKERELALQRKAIILGTQSDDAKMAEAFKLLLKDYPKTKARAEADYWIGDVAFRAKNYKEAVDYLEEARKLEPDQYGEKTSIRLLQSHYYLGDKVATAKEIEFNAKVGKYAVPPEILRWLGTELHSGKAYDSAEKYLLMLTKRDEVMPEDFRLLGESQFEIQKFREATGSFLSYAEKVKGSAQRATALLTLAKAQIALRDFDPAQKSVDEAVALQPEGDINGEAKVRAGDIQLARGNPAEAAKLYETVFLAGIDHPEITPRALSKAIQATKLAQTAGSEEKVKKLTNLLQSRYPEYVQGSKIP